MRPWVACALLLCSVQIPRAAAGNESRDALQRAAALVQQGRLDDADQQARLALHDPDTRAGACSVLGAIRLQQKRFDESATFLREAIRLEPISLAHLHNSDELLSFFMGKNTPERQDFIIDNLKVEKDLVEV